MKTSFTATALAIATAATFVIATAPTPVLANECPKLIKMASDMAQSMKFDETKNASIQNLLTEALADHEAGNHQKSIKDVEAARKLMGLTWRVHPATFFESAR